MAIIFASDAGVRPDHFQSFVSQITQDVRRVADGILDNFSRVTGQPSGLDIPEKENVFVDSGFTNVPGTSFLGTGIDNIDDIQTRRVATQEPILTVYLKKRQFWSLRNEYDTRFMDASEKLFMRATKLLFERKCGQLAAYEALTKASSMISEETFLDSARIRDLLEILGPILDEELAVSTRALNEDLVTAINTAEADTQFTDEIFRVFEQELKKLHDVAENLRQIVDMNDKLAHATHTTWVVDPDDADSVNTGRGSGVIELTMITDLNTSLNIDSGTGSVRFSIQDPYNLMKINNDDIEAALSAAFQEDLDIKAARDAGVSPEEISGIVNRGPAQILDEARSKEEELRTRRKERIANAFGLGGNTGPLNTTEFPEIVFEINPTAYKSRKVAATVTTLPEEFDKNSFRIVLAQLPILEQLDLAENRLVVEIFDLLEEYVSEVERLNERKKFSNSNDSVKYARRQLRKFYLGKSTIQPMDGIHVYIRGKTLKDGEGVGPLDALLTGHHFVQQFAQDRDVDDDVIEEEMRQFGIDNLGISTDLYKLLRTSSFLRNAGTHVFGGLINNVSEDYNASAGTYITNVSGESNMKWLSMSRINVRPSLDQTEGILEDPLTPFKFEIEEGTGLIGGKELLQTNKERIDSGLLNYDDSSARQGQKVTLKNLDQEYVDNGDGTAQIVQTHAPGMVYRWKEGIIAVTRNVNLKKPLDGADDQTNKLAKDFGLTVVSGSGDSGPFANLDAADIVSILVTGFPHNFESFFENARSVGTYTSGENNSGETYFHSFFDIERRKRRALGNFQAFKTINMDQESLHKRVSIQSFLQTNAKSIRNLRTEQAQLRDRLNAISGPKFKDSQDNRRSVAEQGLRDAIDVLQSEIDAQLARYKEAAKQGEELGLRIYGNDPTAALTDTETTDSEAESRKEHDRSIRLRNTFAQIRPQFQCKFNRDNNLFIVGDEYDKDLDIQAFVLQSLNSQEPPIWESGFKNPLEICQNVAKTLDFEFFCDTQGNIQFRPPRYNKTPLSLLLKLFMLEERKDEQLYPDFLKHLFGTRSQTFKERLQNIDTEIAINVAKLGGDASDTILVKAERITDENDNPRLFSLKPVETNSSDITNVENATKRVVDLLNKLRARTGGESIEENSAEEDKIRQEIEDINNPSNPNFNSKRLSLTNKTAQLVSRRQQVAHTLAKIEEHEERFVKDGALSRLSKNMKEKERRELLAPFEDIIEDDFVDFLGPGSGKRYIVYDEQIINSNFIESDNNIEFTRVGVTGEIDLLGDKPGQIGQVPVLWAGATDFDLWRQYGWRSQGDVNKPFFKDAETQCAPYALMLLTRQRRNVVRGTITVYGNEYYQLGDVVYINSRDMLYYVTSVSHQFDYNSGNFQTTLELRYGHPLGEYIPTPLDVIGKALIKNQRTFNRTKTIRETVPPARPVIHLGYVLFESQEHETALRDMLHGQYAGHNVTQLRNAFAKSLKYVNNETQNGRRKRVEIRGYITDNSDENKDKVLRRMKAMRSWFRDPKGRWITTRERFIYLDKESFVDRALNEDQIKKVNTDNDPINVIMPNDFNKQNSRFPREEVFNAAAIVGLDNVVEAVLVED